MFGRQKKEYTTCERLRDFNSVQRQQEIVLEYEETQEEKEKRKKMFRRFEDSGYLEV